VTKTLAALAAASVIALLAAATASALPPRPSTWPDTLALGLVDEEHDAAALRASAPLGMRYHYLSGGANTGGGWTSWAQGNGSFVTDYVAESLQSGFTPVFSYYQLLQSAPAGGSGDEQNGFKQNLRNADTMRAWLDDLTVFFQRAGAFSPNRVVLQVEPDLFGFAQKDGGDDAGRIPVAVTGTLAGLAQEVVRLRDQYAPNVTLGYALSVFGTNVDLATANPSKAQVDALALRSARFYRSLHARFDVAFGEFSNADSAYRRKVRGEGPEAWWDSGDFARHVRYLKRFSDKSGLRIVLWQIPLGNTKTAAVNDTYGHYADNRVQWLLGDPSGRHLRQYVNAGVIGLLFGGAVSGTTCACDKDNDGIDDDGGYFKQRAADYAANPVRLP
jgi:hypothetical protein